MQRRIRELDGLRAFAVAAVVIFHALGDRFPGGFLGVDIFFVISGFIITRVLLQEQAETNGISIKRFYIRRIIRLWPAFFALLLAVVAAQTIENVIVNKMEYSTYVLTTFAAASAMNWIRAFDFSGGGILGHTWSLSVEEQFYLIWPALLTALIGMKKKKILLIVISIASISILWRICLVLDGATAARTYNGLDTRLDALLIGCALAIFGAENIAARWVRTFIPVCLGFIGLAFTVTWQSIFLNTVGFTLVALMAALLVFSAARPDPIVTAVLGNRLAVWLGARSYSLYLWHYPMLHWMGLTGLPAKISIPAAVLASLLAADLSYRFVERPLLKRVAFAQPKAPISLASHAAP